MLKKNYIKKNPAAVVVLYYIAAILIASILLKLPFLIEQGQSITWLDAFFMSNSSIATTGLVTFDYTQVYNYAGWLVLIFLFNIGGMGIMVLNTLIIWIIGKKIGFKQRVFAKLDYNQSTQKNIVYVLRNVLKYFLFTELIGTILIFLKIGYMYDNPIDRFMNAWFMAASAISGSGFYNVVPYQNDFFVQDVLIILMIFSFIGYPVLVDLHEYIKAKLRKESYKFSRFSKIVVKVNVITVLLFMGIFFILERNNSMSSYALLQQWQYSFFVSISTKSVGLNVFANINDWRGMTLFINSIFMLIGGAPSSACGGIRVGAIYIVYKHISGMVTGKRVFKSYGFIIPDRNIMRAYTVVFLYVAIALIATFIISFIQPGLNPLGIWYDVVSGFTTTGFSTGALANMAAISVFIVAILMGIGRIGIMNIIAMTSPGTETEQRIHYVEKEITI